MIITKKSLVFSSIILCFLFFHTTKNGNKNPKLVLFSCIWRWKLRMEIHQKWLFLSFSPSVNTTNHHPPRVLYASLCLYFGLVHFITVSIFSNLLQCVNHALSFFFFFSCYWYLLPFLLTIMDLNGKHSLVWFIHVTCLWNLNV